MRKIEFQTGNYYHVYNRGVDRREIFSDEKDYVRFLRSMGEFNRPEAIGSLFLKSYLDKRREFEEPDSSTLEESGSSNSPLIDTIAYCLLPNHYHLLLKQLADNGISKFMHKLGISHTNYFNAKYKRSGYLFQGKYKCVPIKTDPQFLYVSAYINGNAEIHRIAKAEDWDWSSYSDYLGKRRGTLCDRKIIMEQYGSVGEYKEYVRTVMAESGERKDDIKEFFLE